MAGEEAGVIKTGDLVEASVLSMHGFTPSLEQSNHRVVFVFVLNEDDDPEFVESLLDDLRHSRCKVEPKRFAREMKHVRETLYDFLRVDRDARRLRPRSA